MGVAGVANVGMVVPSITMFQEIPAEADKGRLLAVRGGFGQIGATAGFLVGGVLGEAVGIRLTFLVAGLAVMVLGVAIYLPYRIGFARRRPRGLGGGAGLGHHPGSGPAGGAQAACGDPMESWLPTGAADEAQAWAIAAEEAERRGRREPGPGAGATGARAAGAAGGPGWPGWRTGE